MRNVAAPVVETNTARIVERGRSEQPGNLVILEVRDHRIERQLAGTRRHAESIEPEAPVDLGIDAAHGIFGEVEQALLARHDRAGCRIALDALAIGIAGRIGRVADPVRVVAARQDRGER